MEIFKVAISSLLVFSYISLVHADEPIAKSEEDQSASIIQRVNLYDQLSSVLSSADPKANLDTLEPELNEKRASVEAEAKARFAKLPKGQQEAVLKALRALAKERKDGKTITVGDLELAGRAGQKTAGLPMIALGIGVAAWLIYTNFIHEDPGYSRSQYRDSLERGYRQLPRGR